MGRPSLTPNSRRSHHHDDDSSSVESTHYPRRFPRIGTAFQLKTIPDTAQSYGTDRAAPLLMSEAVPYRTVQDVEEWNESRTALKSDESFQQRPLSPFSSSESQWSTGGYEGTGLRDDDDGSLNQDEAKMATALLETLPKHDHDVQEWMQTVLKWQEIQSKGGTTTTGRRGRPKKRPLAALVDLPLPKRAAIFETLPPNVWSTWITWSGGRASAARRAVAREASKQKSWATTRQIPVLGDFRSDRMAYVKDPTLTTTTTTTGNDPTTLWEAVLACAQALRTELQNKTTVTIYLSQIIAFIDYAQRLPCPEDVFLTGSQASQMLKAIATTMGDLDEMVQQARQHRAKVMDLWHQVGADVETLRQAVEQVVEALVPLRLDETDEWQRQLEVMLKWEKRLETALQPVNDNHLQLLQGLADEAEATHALQTSSLLQLQSKLTKASELQCRIRDWLDSARLESVKWVSNLVRDVDRLQVHMPERTQLLTVHQQAEAWVDRADIAIRSKLGLDELQHLLAQPLVGVDVSDLQDKLQSRVAMAQDWLDQIADIVPGTPTASLAWTQSIRDAQGQGHGAVLHELACEGGRLPVQIPAVQLLQVELEARTWSAKAQKWIPNNGVATTKRGKLGDLKEHMEKAQSLRDRLVLVDDGERQAWVLPGEACLGKLVNQAEAWLEEYRNLCNTSFSMQDLRQIAQKGQTIYVNLSPTLNKVSKVVEQAQEWYNEYAELLGRCCPTDNGASEHPKVDFSELKNAIKAADSELAIDLQEVVELRQVVKRIDTWQNTVAVATGTRPKRGRKVAVTVKDLERLLDEASSLPIDTKQDVLNLQRELLAVKEWQARARRELEEIRVGLEALRQAVDETYGAPANYERRQLDSANGLTGACAEEVTVMDVDVSDGLEATQDTSCSDERRTVAETKPVASGLTCLQKSVSDLQCLIDAFCRDSGALFVATPESEAAAVLEVVARWCGRSLKYLENPRDVFDKRFFGAFDRFFSEGKAFCGSETDDISGEAPGQECHIQRVRSTWMSVVNDQLQRLSIILSDRKKYIQWCESVEALLVSEERKPTLEKLNELASKSLAFPDSGDLVVKVRQLKVDAELWAEKARKSLSAEKKMTFHEAKLLSDEGEKLGFHCPELRQLRSGLKTARGWANRVKRSKLDQGTTQVKTVQSLLDELDELIVEMPDELAKLRQATKNYCICRRPYEGFMIGCDECGDWFHGACIGVSESKADKFEKYVCVRCCTARTYKACASSVAGVIRKWSCAKDLKKARQTNAQRHQRKVRKEVKTIEKLRKEEASLNEKLKQEDNAVAGCCSQEAQLPSERNDPLCAAVLGPAVALPQVSDPVLIADGGTSSPLAVSETLEEKSQESQNNAPSVEVVEMVESLPQVDDKLSKEAIASRLGRIATLIQGCESRLADLDEKLVARKREEELEDKNARLLREWCIRVRSLVLAPLSLGRASESRPHADGSMSRSMVRLIEEAQRFGLRNFEDVATVGNAFACMGWTLRATSVLSRQPNMEAVESLISQAHALNLPDDKALRMMKSMFQRAATLQKKVMKVLTPVPGESTPFDLDTLRDLARAGDDVPLYMPFEPRLATVIEDKGMRHCICGGPSDGRFMLCCDKCEGWFHGHCVGIRKESSAELEEWKCPSCSGLSITTENSDLNAFHDKFDADHDGMSDDDDDSHEDDVSSKAPNPDEMWPPFGLLSSEKAVEALGHVCCAFPDNTDEWKVETANQLDSAAGYHRVSTLESASGLNNPMEVPSLAYPIGSVSLGVTMSFPCTMPSVASSSDGLNRPVEVSSAAGQLMSSYLKTEDSAPSVSSWISRGNDTAQPKESVARGCAGSVSSSQNMLLGTCHNPQYTGLVVPLVNNSLSVPQSVDQQVVSVQTDHENTDEPMHLTTNMQREVLVAPIQDSLRE